MNTFSLKLPKDKINKIKETFKDDIKPSKNEYIDTFISREGLTISIYTNHINLLLLNKKFFIYEFYLMYKRRINFDKKNWIYNIFIYFINIIFYYLGFEFINTYTQIICKIYKFKLKNKLIF